MSNPTGIGGFKKGDPRINRKGRPRTFNALRELAQQIAHEEAQDKNGLPIVINGHVATVAEMILRSMAKDTKRQPYFIEVAFGKVPDELRLGGEGITLKVIYADDDLEANE